MPMIDLGKEMGGDCCPVKMPEEGEKYYPTLYIEGVGGVKFPEEGEARIKYKITRDTKDLKTGKHELVLEVRAIGRYDEDGDEDESHEPKDERGAELDKIVKEVLSKRGEKY